MGSALPKVFRGRGSKERQKHYIIKFCLLAALLTLAILLYFRIPEKNPLFWFIPFGFVFFINAYFILIREDSRYNFEFMLLPPVLLSALAQYYGNTWLNFIILPYVTLVARASRSRNIFLLYILLPMINIHVVIGDNKNFTLMLFYVTVSVTGSIMSMMFGRITKEKERVEESLSSIRKGAKEATFDGPLQDETVISQYFSALLEVDEEIGNLLHAVKYSLYADSASFFQRDSSGQLELRTTTESEGSIIMTAGGALSTVHGNKEGIIMDEIKSGKIDAGYIRKEEFDSLIATCVSEGSYPLGVLAVDSDRYKAFKRSDLKALESFAGMLVNIVRRGRIYPQIKLERDGLKILHEESSQLISTINIDEMCRKIVEGVSAISGAPSVVFLKKGKTYELAESFNMAVPERKQYEIEDTLLDMCVKNRERFYLSDVTAMKKKVLPFKVSNLSSILCLPMIYENDIIGIVVTVSDKIDAFNNHQMELLDVLANQASMSVTNARFHYEIEQMAITDGLTGLFNHRYFQERLTDEMKRVGRSEMPLSLILTDIDFFKKVNDTYGHPAGDAVLREMSQIIRGRMRETDIAARYGGEEFALIMANTDAIGAKKIAEDLRIAVKKTEFPEVDTITISLGISTFPENASTKKDFIDKADQALYFAKENGRNRSAHWLEINR